MCYLTRMVPSDDSMEALEYLQKAASRGHLAAQAALTNVFVQEVINNKNKLILNYFEASAEKYAFSQFQMGQYHVEIEKDDKKAFHFYKLAADQGAVDMKLELGRLFEAHGDLARAITHYKLAAADGLPKAQKKLSKLQAKFPGLMIIERQERTD